MIERTRLPSRSGVACYKSDRVAKQPAENRTTPTFNLSGSPLHRATHFQNLSRFTTRSYGGYGKLENSANRKQSRLDVWSFQRKLALILLTRDRRTVIFSRKMMPPGTIRVISVPEFEELTSVSLPPMRAARSRIP